MHLLVTNDFPPKIGGIQSYLWELWRRLPPDEFVVLTSPHRQAAAWDRAQPFRVVRTREPVLLPHPWLRRQIDRLAEEIGATFVVLDPALPLGWLGPYLERPYAVVLHGAEVTVPGRLPGSRSLLARVLREAKLVIAAGGYPASEAEHAAGQALPIVNVPPGVDVERFVPLGADQRGAARARFGLPAEGRLVVAASRLVPRKGFDTLIRASARLAATHPDVTVAITGGGRDAQRLAALAAELAAPVRFLGRLPDADMPDAYGMADLFAMLCRSRWAGLEQEGFGIVFLEAAAAGVPQLAGRSGGAAEAVVEGETGSIVDRPHDEVAVAAALGRLLDDGAGRARMGLNGRRRAEELFTYDRLAARLAQALAGLA
ncbi:MAG: glycosyltransferase [Acidimicrobiia bacterium]|nr:glycosyltransferase [Acidimicrobiia bacterium]